MTQKKICLFRLDRLTTWTKEVLLNNDSSSYGKFKIIQTNNNKLK
jgi:hypothetical protein